MARVGYACVCLGRPELRCQRTTVLRRATPERLRELIAANIEGLRSILAYNETRGYRLFRIGGAFIPFASHPTNELRWWEEFDPALKAAGTWARGHAHRLSFHTSPFAILNSVNAPVVDAGIAEVIALARVLEAMGLGPEHKVILHLGVTTPTREAAEDRLVAALDRVPEPYRGHLALENDDRLYSAERAVAMGHRTGLPVVLDVFHHACLPGAWGAMPTAELLDLAFATWRPEHGPPKIHFSSQDPAKRPGAHAEWVDAADLQPFLADSSAASREFDVMFEAKGKDLALDALRQSFP